MVPPGGLNGTEMGTTEPLGDETLEMQMLRSPLGGYSSAFISETEQ